MTRPIHVLSVSLATLALAVTGCSKESKDAGERAGKVETPTPSPSPAAAADPAPGATAPAPAPAAGSRVGKPAPDFTLEDLDGRDVSLASFRGKTVVLEWFNPECPYVKRAHGKGSLLGAAKQHAEAGVAWLAINSGAPGKQGHDPQVNAAAAKQWELPYPVLRDETGEVGRAYGATNTPHMYVIDPSGTVVYAGAIDNSPDGEQQTPEGGTLIKYVDAALGDLAAGRPVAIPETKAYGCGVKYAS